MEFEKNFFIIHQRILAFRFCFGFCVFLFVLFMLLFVFYGAVCVYSDITYTENSIFIDPLYNELKSMHNGSIPESLIMSFVIRDVPKNTYIIDGNYNGSYYEYMQFAGQRGLLHLSPATRQKYGFENVTILIDPNTFTNSSIMDFLLKNVIGYKSVLINQIIYGFQDVEELVMMDESSRRSFIFSRDYLDGIDYLKNPGSAILQRIVGVIRIIFGLFLASNITSLYFLITIIGIPIFILIISTINRLKILKALMKVEVFLRFYDHPQLNSFRFLLFRTFPWLGIYLHAINLNNKTQIRWIFFSQIGLMIVFYCIYVSLFEFLNSLLFDGAFPLGIDLKFYILIVVLEVCSFLFMRTRTSLKYFPIITFLLEFIFCFYIQFNGYAFYDEAFYCIMFASLGFFFMFVAFLEIKALKWNPSYHYTPSSDKPRALYNPLFSMAWYYDLPPLWTMFYPLHDRSTFTENEMALVDRKYLVLNQLLSNNQGEDAHNENNNPIFGERRRAINNPESNSVVSNRGFSDVGPLGEVLLNGDN